MAKRRPGSEPPGEWDENWQRIVGRILAVTGCVLVGLAIPLLLPSETVAQSVAAKLWGGAAAISGVLLWCASYRVLHRHNKHIDVDGTKDLEKRWKLVPTVTPEFVDECTKLAARRFDKEIAQAAAACVDFSSFAERTVEHLDLRPTRLGRRISRSVSLEAESILPDAKRLIFPIARPRKGELLDEFEVNVDGKAAQTLGYKENLGLNALILESFIQRAYQAELPPDDAFFRKFRRDAVIAGCSPAPLSGSPSEPLMKAMAKLNSAVREARSSQPTPVEKEELEKLQVANAASEAALHNLESLLEFMLLHYFIFLEVPINLEKGGRNVEIELSISAARTNYAEHIRNRFKLLLGVGIEYWWIDLLCPFETTSYHLRASAPAGTYLYRIQVQAFSDDTSTYMNPPPPPVAPRHVVVAKTRGTDVIHVYAVGLDALQLRSNSNETRPGIRLYLHLRAVPPGVLAPLTMLSGYLATLTLIFAWKHDGLFNAESAAAIALILAIPGLMTGWLASRLTTATLWASSYMLVLELLGLLMLSAWATVVSVLKVTASEDVTWQWMHTIGVYVPHPVWFVTSVLCASHSVMCAADLISRTWRHQRSLQDR